MDIKNYLLKRLPTSALNDLKYDLSPISFEANYVFQGPRENFEIVYFLQSGIASVVAETVNGRTTLIGMLGREGMTCHSLYGGDTQSPFWWVAHVGGDALVIPAARLLEHSRRHHSIDALLTAYARAFSLQTAFTNLATGSGRIERRLARWLLMAHDRIDGNVVPITHQALSDMLGVRRASVTETLQILEGERLIKAVRASVIIVDREGLIDVSDGSYGPAEEELLRLTGISIADEFATCGKKQTEIHPASKHAHQNLPTVTLSDNPNSRR